MRTILVYCIVKSLSALRILLEFSHFTIKLIFIPGLEKLRWNIGKMKAYKEFLKAKRTVPAYKNFLINKKIEKIIFDGLIPNLDTIPVMDKENYIKRYSIDERCKYGKIPKKGIIVDESSGSTGIPTNWVRSAKERKANKRLLEVGLKQLLGEEEKFIINAFALGPWATGINITMSFADEYIVKSLGPDISKIENALHFFGYRYNYIIMGYPPFLKSLVDTAKVDWEKLNVVFIYGGEGMSEAMREYLIAKGIKKIYGSLGASDLELNIGSENDFTIALRKLLGNNKMLASRLVKYPGSLPVIFQYNPLDFFIETNEEGELIITLCRPYYISPKIRYNIHDKGHVWRMSELIQICNELNIDIKNLGKSQGDFPLLFHYGRADMSVAYFGCKISPADIQQVIFKIPELAPYISSFVVLTYEDKGLNQQLSICLELITGKNNSEFNEDYFNDKFFIELEKLNQDFRESLRMVSKENKPRIEFYNQKTGLFKDKNINTKQNYFITSSTPV